MRAPLPLVLYLGIAACSASQKPSAKAGPADDGTPTPSWVLSMRSDSTKVCGMGVAGAGFENSPYPKQAARERAVTNLAGAISTSVEEAIIDNETTSGVDVEYARLVHVGDALIKVIDGMASVEFWLVERGKGPYGEKGFTYAWGCIPKTDAATTLKLDPKALASKDDDDALMKLGAGVPGWLNQRGKRKNGRFCAIGYSDPTFNSENTFSNVVEDVRVQLAETISSLVSGYFEEQTTDQSTYIQSMTVSSNQALAKGVMVTQFWYDVKGKGPHAVKRSTYGYGCVYPMDIVASSLSGAELPKQTVQSVRDHAQAAFDALDAMEAKQQARK